MQDIIKEVYSLTTYLRNDNQRLLQLIKQLSSQTPLTTPKSVQPEPIDKSTRTKFIDTRIPKISKQSSLQSSTYSVHTIKNEGKRHNTCQSTKSRKTQKNSSLHKPSVANSRHETNMTRLKKISQKMGSGVDKGLLVKKKSRIFHFQTHI